jgi:hypothetical protein
VEVEVVVHPKENQEIEHLKVVGREVDGVEDLIVHQEDIKILVFQEFFFFSKKKQY